MMNEYIRLIKTLLLSYENQDNAVIMKKYMRDQFAFIGMKAPQRKELVRKLIKLNGIPSEDEFPSVIAELWQAPEREYQYLALELLDRKMKHFEEKDMEWLENLIVNKSWWDTVDWIASKHIGSYFMQYPGNKNDITRRWIDSNDIWLKRTAILFQLKYKTRTDEKLLYAYINQCLGSTEFFINKAIGWALREYSKTNPQSVINFVEQTPLTKLSKTEALKVIKKKQKQL